jgi:hypothetical protein
MIGKRVSLNTQKSNIFENSSKNHDKENCVPFRDRSDKKAFKTPEKKQQITIENRNTTVTITNYFHQSKSSYLKENKDKDLYELKGLEKRLDFNETKDNTFTLQKKKDLNSNSSQSQSQLSITYSELKRKGFNLRSKRFHSSKKSSINNSFHGSLGENSSINSYNKFSSDALKINRSMKYLSDCSYSDKESDTSLDSKLCCHKMIPSNKINDENYKIIALKKLRKTEIPNVKSVNCKFYEYKRRPFEYGKRLLT